MRALVRACVCACVRACVRVCVHSYMHIKRTADVEDLNRSFTSAIAAQAADHPPIMPHQRSVGNAGRRHNLVELAPPSDPSTSAELCVGSRSSNPHTQQQRLLQLDMMQLLLQRKMMASILAKTLMP